MGSSPVLIENMSKGTECTSSLPLAQPSHSQTKLFSNLYTREPHYVRANNLYGNSAVKVSFVVMNTGHKLSP
jgi:hypothetical protein